MMLELLVSSSSVRKINPFAHWTRRGELAALRWQDCDFENDTFQIEHSYYWRRGGILKSTKTEAREAASDASGIEARRCWNGRRKVIAIAHGISCSPSRLYGGRKALDLAAVLKRKIRPAFDKLGIVAWLAHIPAYVGTVLAELGEHQFDDPRLLAPQQSQCDQQVFAGGIEDKANAPGETGRGYFLPWHLLPAGKTAETLHPYCTQIPKVPTCKLLKSWRGRRDSNSRPLP